MELDLNIDSNGNVIVNTLSEYVAYISQLQAANEGSNERFFFRGQSNKNWDGLYIRSFQADRGQGQRRRGRPLHP